MVVYTEPSNVEIDNVPVLPHSVKMMHQRTPKTPYGTHIFKNFWRGAYHRDNPHAPLRRRLRSLDTFAPSALNLASPTFFLAPQLFLSGAGTAFPSFPLPFASHLSRSLPS